MPEPSPLLTGEIGLDGILFIVGFSVWAIFFMRHAHSNNGKTLFELWLDK